MNTKQQLRRMVRRILKEDGDAFEKGLAYIKDIEGLKTDAIKFAQEKGNEEEAKEWFQDGVGEWIKELGDTAEAIDDLGEEMLSNYRSEDGDEGDEQEESTDLSEEQQELIDKIEKQKDVQGFVSLYKKLCNAFDLPTMSSGAFVQEFRSEGVEATVEKIKNEWKDVYPDIGDILEKLTQSDTFKPKEWGIEEKGGDDEAGSEGSDEEEATVQEVEDDLEDMEGQLEDFVGGLEEFIEEAYDAKDTEAYKALEKSFELMNKYGQFIMKLFGKIVDFAQKKKRQDVVDLTSKNVDVCVEWSNLRNEQLKQLQKELAAADEGYDLESEEINPSEKTMNALAKFYKETTDNFKTIVANIKKNPLKELNKDNVLKEAHRHGQGILLEVRRRNKADDKLKKALRRRWRA